MVQFQEETGHEYNLETTPAEGTSARLARIDKKRFPSIITAGKDEPCYTNSTQIPVEYTDDIFEVVRLQDELQSYIQVELFSISTLVKKLMTKKLVKTNSKYLIIQNALYLNTPTFSV